MFDISVIGGGIVGLSTARELQIRFPTARLLVLEKENTFGEHQTGRNSGVIHSGIYYKPGSLKAKMALQGNASMQNFCKSNGIPYEICGKLIVATHEQELCELNRLQQRGVENGLSVTRLSPEQAKEREPHVKCIAALLVPSTGITDYRKVLQVLADQIQESGGELQFNSAVWQLRPCTNGTTLVTANGTFETRFFVNCAGLQSDRVAGMDKCETSHRIVPFRGEYYELRPARRHLVKQLIYPVPDPSFPFLGVHFTRMVDGSIHAGPNAVLSLKREGYTKFGVDLKDAADTLLYPGFWRLARKHYDTGMAEVWRSFSKAAFTRSLQRLIPEITAEDLIVSEPGVRAQALRSSGNMVDDFLIAKTARGVHVCNAPSPAATASLEIAKYISQECQVLQ